MADSSTNVEQIETQQSQKEVTVNGLFDAASPALFGGRHAEACVGLTWGYYGGRWGGSSVANGTVTLAGSSSNYLTASRTTGAISLSVGSPSTWSDPDNHARLYKITTNVSAVTSYEDHRLGPGGLISGAGAGGSIALDDLTDVATAGQSNGFVLRYDSGAGLWKPHTLSQLLSLANLTDIDITSSPSADTGDLLARDSDGKWRPKAPSDLGINPTLGKHSIPIMATGMSPSSTGGCAALATIASSSGHPDIQTLDFDATTAEYAQFSIPMPKKWNRGTVTAKFVWSHAATTTNFGVVWELQALAVSDADSIDAAFGTSQTQADTGGTTNSLYVSPECSAITIAGTPQAEDVVFFRVNRKPSDGSDTMAIDARLHSVILYLTTSAANDA